MTDFKIIEQDIKEIKNLIRIFLCSDEKVFQNSINSYFQAPSKFLRPALCVLFQKALRQTNNEKILMISAALEMAHNASLLHDDVIDEAQIRRNEPSFNYKTNDKIAIMAGDFLISKVLEILNKVGDENIYSLFAVAFQNMALSEIAQYYNHFKFISLEEYYKKNELKTGSLFNIAVLSPFYINNLSDEKIFFNLKEFVKYFSNAFQIRDDMFNYFGLKDNKPVNTDEKQGVYTLPVLLENTDKSCKLYEECCKILAHKVKLSVESIDFLEETEYKKQIIDICQGLLEGI